MGTSHKLFLVLLKLKFKCRRDESEFSKMGPELYSVYIFLSTFLYNSVMKINSSKTFYSACQSQAMVLDTEEIKKYKAKQIISDFKSFQ